MPFSLQYKPFIEKDDDPISKTLVRPKNIYKIVYYQYADGTSKSLSGPKTTYVFVIGIYDKKLVCLKVSEIKPDKFFKWLNKLYIKGLTEEKWAKAEKLEDLIIEADVKGSKIFNSFVKPDSVIYGDNPNIYRTYNLTGIKQIEEVKFKKDVLKSYSK